MYRTIAQRIRLRREASGRPDAPPDRAGAWKAGFFGWKRGLVQPPPLAWPQDLQDAYAEGQAAAEAELAGMPADESTR